MYVRLLAREIVQTRRTSDRLLTAKAQLNSVSMALQSSVALLKVQGVVSKSTDIMKAMSKLISLPEIQATMMEMAREMERAGLVEEMVADAFALTEPDDLEVSADAEVNKVIAELTADLLAPAGAAPTSKINNRTAAVSSAADMGGAVSADESSAAADADLSALQARLGAL